MKLEDTLPMKNLPRRVPLEFHTWFFVSTRWPIGVRKGQWGNKSKSKKKPRHDMREEGSQEEKKRKDWMEGRRKRPSPEHHLHIPHIHSHFYRSVHHLGSLHRHMRIHVYLRRFDYRDPHRMRICTFHKEPRVVEKGMLLDLDKIWVQR